MDLIVGTTAGVFLADSDSGTAAEGLQQGTVRQLIRADGHLFAAASDGVYCSADGGSSWTRSGVDGGEVWSVAVSPDDLRTIYASTQPAHLFVSHDAGQSWQEIGSFLQVPDAERWCVPDNPNGARALSIAIDPFNARRCWVGVEVGGVIGTEDGGQHWSVVQPCGNADVHQLLAHPQQPDALFATMGAGRMDNRPGDPAMPGPYASNDGGRTWRHLGTRMQPHYTRAMCVDPRPPFVLTVPAVPSFRSSMKDPDGAQSVLFRSEDGGASWRSLGDASHSPSRVRLTAVTPDPAEAGGVLVGTEAGEVWRVSPDAEWRQVCQGLPAVQSLLAQG
jgi:photosystem II stability/assembly factor-like uncharacterized protein